MPTFMTYGSLIGDLQAYLERGGSAATDPTVFAQLPRLVNATERKIIQYLKLQGLLEVLTDPGGGQVGGSMLTQGVAVYTKPDRWRQTVSMNYGSGGNFNRRTALFPRSYEYCRGFWPDDSATDPTKPPTFYADYDLTHWLIVPTPAANFPLEALCYMQPPLLDPSNQTNFFTQYTPNCLLYGALLEASPFIKNDPRIATWQDWWDKELTSLAQQDLQKVLDRSQVRRTA